MATQKRQLEELLEKAWRNIKVQVDFVKNSDILVMKLVVCISKYVHANGNKLLGVIKCLDIETH